VATLVVTLLLTFGLYGWRHVDSLRESSASTPASTGERIRLAVLPFVNLSADPEQEYFSDGLTEELIAPPRRAPAAAIGCDRQDIGDALQGGSSRAGRHRS
jgi:hypothetical protein